MSGQDKKIGISVDDSGLKILKESTTFKDLDVADYLELKKAYDEQFVPWWNDVLLMFNPPKKSEDEISE